MFLLNVWRGFVNYKLFLSKTSGSDVSIWFNRPAFLFMVEVGFWSVVLRKSQKIRYGVEWQLISYLKLCNHFNAIRWDYGHAEIVRSKESCSVGLWLRNKQYFTAKAVLWGSDYAKYSTLQRKPFDISRRSNSVIFFSFFSHFNCYILLQKYVLR